MNITDLLGKKLLFFDGAMGTLLQEAGLPIGTFPDIWNIQNPDAVRTIHEAYLSAGCDILKTNTFGCNRLKLKDTGYSVPQLVTEGVRIAKKAASAYSGDKPRFVALDIGPTGKLLKPIGDLDFEEAYQAFKETIEAGAAAGADLVLIETQNDTYELKAAVLAAMENCTLPVFATVTADAKGKLLTGGDMPAVAALLEGLGVSAFGLNCGLGPVQMLPMLTALREASSLPLILNPNAGLPRRDGANTVFDISAQDFAKEMKKAAHAGAWILGGCCGTTPEHIAQTIAATQNIMPIPIVPKTATVVSSYSHAVTFGHGAVLIGERINPTGKKKMKQALVDHDMDYLLREGITQEEHGAAILDVNVGLPGIDEATVMQEVIQALQGVSSLPLQIDTSDEHALAGALRIYNGKPLINSVNGKQESIRAVFPLAKKYGGVIVALTLDEAGIPETAEGRLAVAKRIVEEAAKYGIQKKDIIVDPLTLAVSAQPDAAKITLEALKLIRRELGVETLLGLSNVSFGLPARAIINGTFFTLAMGAGLGAAIMNPYSDEMMGAYRAYKALYALDDRCQEFIDAYSDQAQAPVNTADTEYTLGQAIQKGLRERAEIAAKSMLKNAAPMEIIENELVPALNKVGTEFEAGRVFLPQLLMSAEAAKAAFEVIKAEFQDCEQGKIGKIVLATVKGDIHDIGKNIVKSLLENFRFDVIDLGRDVAPEIIVQAAKEHGVILVGLSALMTTTLGSMEETIRQLNRACPACKVIVGGAVLTEDYAKKIGADCYAKDAMDAVRYAERIFPHK